MTYLDPIRQAAQEFAPPPQEPEHHFADFDKEDPALKPVQASMAGSHFDDFDTEAPKAGSTGEAGSLKRTGQEYLRGIYRGGLGLIGAAKDIGPAIFQGKEMTSGAKMIHELGLDPPEDATWYERLANTAGQLTPGALTGMGITGKVLTPIASDIAASQVFGPLGEKIGQKLGLAPGRAQALGIAASMAGSGGTATGINRVAGRFRPPTGEQILDSATKGYKAVENMPIIWDPTALATNVTAPLARRMENSGADLTAPTAYKMLSKLQPTGEEGSGVANGRLWGVQKNLKELAKQTDAQGHYTADAHFAGQTVKAINQFMEAAKDNPSWALSGSEHLPTMSSTLAKANQDYSSAMWDDTFGKAYEKAKLRASSVTTGGNLPNNVRQEFAKFLDPFHPARALGLKPDELTQVNQIVRGKNWTQNMLRGMGGVAPESKLGLYAQATGLGMAAGGNLGGLMLPAVGVMGSLAKRASNKLQRGQIESLRNMVRSRSALAQSMRAGPHGGAGEGAEEAAEAGLAGILGEEAPEWINRAAGAGADTGANAEKEKEAEGGGYSMGHRLLKAVGGYDSSYFNGPYSAIESGSAGNTTQPTPADVVNTNFALNRADPNFTIRDYARNPDIRKLSQDIGTAMAPIEAYHGSPHSFDKFSSEKIGTGEGAQAYGHGLYFAENEGVAKSYKKAGLGWRSTETPDPTAGHMYQVEIGSEPEHFLDWDKPLSEQSPQIQRAVAQAHGAGVYRPIEKDLPKYQSMTGEEAVRGLGQKMLAETARGGMPPAGFNGDAQASKALQDAGIPGIRYLDAGSRDADARVIAVDPKYADLAQHGNNMLPPRPSPSDGLRQLQAYAEEGGEGSIPHQVLQAIKSGKLKIDYPGTHNYVVFDPSIIRIMRKYGIFGPATVAGSAMGQQKGKDSGGYDSPQGEQFADPQAFRLRLARLAAMPQTGIGGGSPMPSYQVGGYDWPWSMKGAKSRPEPVDIGGTGSKYLFGSFSTVSKPHPPKGGASMQDPDVSDEGGGYDDPYASNPMSPDFQFGQQTGGLLGAIGAGVNRGIIAPFANSVAGSIPAPYESPAAVAPALWNAIGRARGARRFGGYGMGQVSPLAGGGGF